VPVDRLCEHPAKQQPDRAAGNGDERVDPDRLGLLPGVREHRHDHPQDYRRRQRSAHTLDEARSDQQALALGERTEQRRAREHGETDEKDAPLADQVADPTGQQEQATKRDQVRVHHPREIVLREAEILLDRRQGDVHDRRVENDHQHPDAEDVQGQPASPIGNLSALLHLSPLT
jgi:hypothetical protein